jgi:hypothetical protein
MNKINWRNVRPTNIQDAFQWCIRYAKQKRNISVESIADVMGVNHWTLYKWIGEADMPAKLIRGFENACGIDYVSRWTVESAGKMVIDIPRGRKCDGLEIHNLQTDYHTAVGLLMSFYTDLTGLDETLASLQNALEQTAWHQGNVKKYRQPELPFDEED